MSPLTNSIRTCLESGRAALRRRRWEEGGRAAARPYQSPNGDAISPHLFRQNGVLSTECFWLSPAAWTTAVVALGIALWLNACARPEPLLAQPVRGIPLTVTEPSGVARRGDVVTSGVPLPKGRVPRGAALVLVDAEGQVVPAGIRVTARWRDDSAMWVLLDFQTDLAPGQSKTFRLVSGAEADPFRAENRPRQRVSVAETDDAITVRTGVLTARIRRKSFSLLEAVTRADGTAALKAPGRMILDLEHTPPGAPNEEQWLRKSGVAANTPSDRFEPARSKKPFTAKVEVAGPLRTVIRLDGWHANPDGREEFPYTVRLTFHAGKPWVWIMHTVVFTGEVKQDFLRRLGMEFDVAGEDQPTALLGGATPHAAPAEASRISLLELGPSVMRHKVPYTEVKPVSYQVETGLTNAAPVASGEWARGWATLRSGPHAATLAVRDFAKLFPKELAVDLRAGTLAAWLWPDRGDQVLDLRRRYDYVDSKTHYDLGMWPKGGRGIAKTHEVLLWFHGGNRSPADIEATVTAFNHRLFAFARPEWYSQCEVFPKFHPRDPTRFPRFEAIMDVAMEWRLRNQSQFGWYGFIDYGDTLFHGYETPCHSGDMGPKSWCSRGYVGWLNCEGVDRVNLIHALRGNDRRIFDYWEAMVRHITDIDTLHYDENPANVGAGHRHDQQHWGNWLIGYGTATFGATDLYLLKGDLRGLDVAKEYVNFHRGGGGGEDEYVGGYLERLAAVTGNQALDEEARKEVREDYYGFQTGKAGNLDQPHFRCSVIQHPSLLEYLILSEDGPMRDYWVAAARQRVRNLSLDLGGLQFAYAWRFSRDPVFLDAPKLHYSMFGPYMKPRPQEFFPDQVLPKAPRDMTFEELAALAKGCVNNIYGDSYTVSGQFPYLLAAAAEAGLSESDLLDHPPRLRKGGEAWDWAWTAEPVAGADPARIRAVDLRGAANANPWNELRVLDAPLAGAPPVAGETLRFEFLTWGHVEPGGYPVREVSVYPTTYRNDFTVREEGSYVYGLPWGGRIELGRVPFDLIHPGANNGKSVILLRDQATVSLPVNRKGKRLFLLLVGDASPFDHEVGAHLTLRYADGKAETRELRNLRDYENWHFWGFTTKAWLGRAFKISELWDGLATLIDLLEIPLREAPLAGVELSDTGKGHRVVILAASVETGEAQASAKPTVCNLAGQPSGGEGWTDGLKNVAPSDNAVRLSGPATYHLNVPRGSYRVDLEASNCNGLAEVLVNGQPVTTPWTLSRASIGPTGTPWERISVWGRAEDRGLDLTVQAAPGKGLWRHHTVHDRGLSLRYLAVTPEDPPAIVPPPAPAVHFGWREPVNDFLRSSFRNAGATTEKMVVGSGKAQFQVAVPPGRYQLLLLIPAYNTGLPQFGQICPGPARLTLPDGKTYAVAKPEKDQPVRVDLATTVGPDGRLSFAIEPVEGAENWGIARAEIRRAP